MRNIVVVVLSAVALSVSAAAETLTLESTLNRLLAETMRGRIIAGSHQVAEDKFSAEKIGYYVPEVSFNTTLPTYQKSQDYGYFYGFPTPIFFDRSNFAATGNIRMNYKIITGGDLSFESRVNVRNDEYPVSYFDPGLDTTVIKTAIDKRRLADLYLQFSQPLFRTSESRAAYLDARDNLDKADIEYRKERADLKEEGIAAYSDLLIAEIDLKIAQHRHELAAYNARWDSVKFADGVLTEENWIMSKSDRLERRLAVYDAEANFEEKTNDFNHLLDLESETRPSLEVPPVPPAPDETRSQLYIANVEHATEVELARVNLALAERKLDQTKSSYGVNGTLNASYSIGRGTVTQSQPREESEDKIDTEDWRISLDFSYPIWDGGASGASIHSQELAYESARLEYLAAQRSARNNMEILLRRIEINNAKLSLLTQEVELAEKKLVDAESRFEDGLISEAALLENRVYFLEARKSRTTTLREYYLDLTELEKVAL